jgi:hypothetical protein
VLVVQHIRGLTMTKTCWRAERAARAAAVGLMMALALAGCGGGGDDDGGTTPPPGTFALSVTLSGNGSVTSQPAGIDCGTACSTNVPANTDVTLTATPAAGHELQAWGGACASASGSTCTVSVQQATSASATFIPVAGGGGNVALAVAVTGNGRITSQPAGIDCGSTCNASFAAASTVTLTAAPAAGQVLQAWGGACSGSAATCTVTMSTPRNVTAAFAVAPPSSGGAWGTAALLENSNDFNVADTNAFANANVLSAIDAAGNALVIWQQSDATSEGRTQKVFSRHYVAGQGWSAAVTVPGLTTSSSSVALVTGRLVIDAAGNATWVRSNFETRRHSAAAGWSASAFAPAGSTGGTLADVKLGGDSTVHILGIGGSVLYSRLAPGSSQWTAWADVSQSSLSARNAQLALGAAGGVLAIWSERNPGDGNNSMKANRSVGGAWQAPVRIEELLTDVNDSTPRIASDANGNAIAAWNQGSSVYTSRFDAATAVWATPTEIDAGQVGGSPFSANIQLVVAADGRAVLTWSATFALKSASAPAGAAWSAPVVVNAYSAGYFLGIDNGGRAVVVYRSVSQWPNPTDATQNLYVRELPLGGTWSAAALLETGVGDVKGNAPCAMNTAGDALCSWAQDDLAGTTVRNSLWAVLRR